MIYPHHTHERHDAEAGELLSSRADHPVLLTAAAWLVPPADGDYDLAATLTLEGDTPCSLAIGPDFASLAAADDDCAGRAVALRRGVRYALRLAAVLGAGQQLALGASVATANGSSYQLPAVPAEWFEGGVGSTDADHAVVTVNGLPASCRARDGCNVTISDESAGEDETVDEDVVSTIELQTPGQQQQQQQQADGARVSRRRRLTLLQGCPSSCCVVIFRDAPGAYCSPVPMWDLETWSHPGGPFITASMLCDTVRYEWLLKSGHHVNQDDPQDMSLATLTGGATKAGMCASQGQTLSTRVGRLCIVGATSSQVHRPGVRLDQPHGRRRRAAAAAVEHGRGLRGVCCTV